MATEFLNRFIITNRFIPAPSRRRSGVAADKIKFIVAHDTGNPGSSALANVKFFINTCDSVEIKKIASAHIFLDDKEIIECVPALTAKPEKAFHVLRNKPRDNEIFGVDANDAAIGVEYCYGGNIDADKAYQKYVWVLAKLCHVFELDPATKIVGHFFLDPERKTDPLTGLAQSRRTYDQLLLDVVREFKECTGQATTIEPLILEETTTGFAQSTATLNIRKKPSRLSDRVQQVPRGTNLKFNAIVKNGESINNNPVWFRDENRNFFWSGGTTKTV